MKIALAQINPIVGDLMGNQKKIAHYINRAKDKGADIVVFPELALCGYPPEDLLYNESFVRDNLIALESLVEETKGIWAVIGFVDRDKTNLYNAAAIIFNGKIKGIYHKQELPNYGVFDEKRYFSAGDEAPVFSLGKIKFGVNICEDIWIDESVYKKQAKKKAKLLINISSSPYDLNKLETRENLLKKRAKETKAFICYANLVGGQDELVFDGGSFIVSPKGEIIAAAKEFAEDLLIADLPVGKPSARIKKQIEVPFTHLERVYQALVLGTRDYIQKNGFQKVLIGVSGGIDSALVAAIAVDAVGKNNVIGVSMPSRYSSAGTRTDAKVVCDNLAIQFIEIPIEDIYISYLTTLVPQFGTSRPNTAEENLQARIRGNLLMALSNKFGWLVLTTGNKSEIGVGYCTLYGDMSGGFAVIKDVPKTLVYELAKLKNTAAGRLIIPESVIKRAPSAELRENQTDQDTLPEYKVLDALLEGYVERHEPLAKLSKRSSNGIAKKIITMIDQSEYKRRQAAPGVKITPRAFGKDWRLPITNKYREL